MKKTALLIFSLILGTISITAQDNCSKYYPMIEGTTFEYTNTDKKGKTEGITSYKISDVSQNGGATNATFNLKYVDKKGKEVFSTAYNITCDGNMVKIDYQSLFPSQMMQQYTDMGVEMDISGTDIELPNNLKVGQELDDANVSVSMNMSGIKMKMEVDQTERVVKSKESVTTAAGTFDCYVITETTRSKTMGATQEMISKLWLAEGVGMVKQETYKKNGNLMSTTELTKFSR
ncbi:hypothetical protein ACEZ3G_09035 [Maribacter algicola]|uniref:Uncharacterized protein n=1 Tax=Meishania litoralis TaxID=3434685 RepID=A0ACC7LIP9_9FLAO